MGRARMVGLDDLYVRREDKQHYIALGSGPEYAIDSNKS